MTDWRQASCVGKDPEIWFREEDTDQAVEICKGCPLRFPCRALRRQLRAKEGVWGGIPENSRRRKPPPPPPRRFAVERAARYRDLIDAGMDPVELAASEGKTLLAVEKCLRRQGHNVQAALVSRVSRQSGKESA